ncbi:MAG: putative anti-sigma regulatory factor, serine/threonine protein kinase [Flaviaesturariibacter sp.]|nr:putative anti-sigma regulatory factor, serine/threonine protein kinase [Flaviaesturariibacter sp.]
MVSRIHACLKVADRSYFAIIKKEVHALALSAGFSEGRTGEIDIVVAEMVTNLVKHGGGGELLVKLVEQNGQPGIEILSVDNGPGMTDVTRMVADGVSTKNTLGQGLGAMKRLSDTFQVYSQKDWGTVILCRLFLEPVQRFVKPPPFDIRSVLIPKPGEQACGDGFSFLPTADGVRLFLGDGLGHGPEAEKAVRTALDAFERCEEESPTDIIRYINGEVKKTRGLVGTAAVYKSAERKWLLCGVGNIATRFISVTNVKSYTAYNGIIGLNVPTTMKSQEIPHEAGQQIVMCSDGLKSKWDTFRFPAIFRYDLSILATSLLKDFARHTDDMSVAICKING